MVLRSGHQLAAEPTVLLCCYWVLDVQPLEHSEDGGGTPRIHPAGLMRAFSSANNTLALSEGGVEVNNEATGLYEEWWSSISSPYLHPQMC